MPTSSLWLCAKFRVTGVCSVVVLATAGCQSQPTCPPIPPLPTWVAEEFPLDISDDAQVILCSRAESVDGPSGTYVLDRRNEPQVEFVKEYNILDESFRLSPNGERVCYSDGDVHVFDRTDSSNRRLTWTGNNAFYPDWDPTGQKIVYTMTGRPRGVADSLLGTFIVDVAGGGQVRLTSEGNTLIAPGLSWSPDGKYLAFEEEHVAGIMKLKLFDVATQTTSRTVLASTDADQSLHVIGWKGLGELIVGDYHGDRACEQFLVVNTTTGHTNPLGISLVPNRYPAATSRSGVWMCFVDQDSSQFQGVLFIQRLDDPKGVTRRQVSTFVPAKTAVALAGY